MKARAQVTKVSVGNEFVDARGRPGTVVRFLFGQETGLAHLYHFTTHGKTDDEVLAARDRIAEHHAERVARWNGFEANVRRKAVPGFAEWTVTDCVVQDAGEIPDVRLVVAASSGAAAVWFDLLMSIDALPSDDEILAEIAARVEMLEEGPTVRKPGRVVHGLIIGADIPDQPAS